VTSSIDGELLRYTGGTPAFQCADVPVTAPVRFDRACLAVSLLSALGAVQPQRAPHEGWRMDDLRDAVSSVADEALQLELHALLAADDV
jgi:hypothetical protein